MVQLLRTEGIVLHSLPFRDYDLILSIFTPDNGLIKCILNKANASKQKSMAAAPLSQIEFVYETGKSDLFRCQEYSLLNPRLKLRNALETLEAACDMLQTILVSQMPHQPAPDLYGLMLHYMDRLTVVKNPYAMSASFQLKALRHDGFFELDETLPFTPEELPIVAQLAFCRTHKDLEDLQLDSTLREKITLFFRERIR